MKWLIQILANTVINKNTAASAVGSGSVIVVLFTALSDRVTIIDTKVDENFNLLKGEAAVIRSQVMDDVVKKHEDVIKHVDRLTISIQDFRNETNKKLDTLDKRVYELNQKKE